jgi:hypothetical protein
MKKQFRISCSAFAIAVFPALEVPLRKMMFPCFSPNSSEMRLHPYVDELSWRASSDITTDSPLPRFLSGESCQPLSSHNIWFKPLRVLKFLRLPSLVRIEPRQASCLPGNISAHKDKTKTERRLSGGFSIRPPGAYQSRYGLSKSLS